MLLLHFEWDDIKNCKSVADVYRMMGIGTKDSDPQDLKFSNKEVFGEKAYYANLFITDKADKEIYDHLKSVDRSVGSEWAVYCPVSNGPRYDKITAVLGKLNDSVLYVVEPSDKDLYEEYPLGGKDEQSTAEN